MHQITLEQFQRAKKFLESKNIRSPLIPYNPTYPSNNILLKAENLLPTGSFKIRGATYTISKLTPKQKKNGVIAFSTGNHAQGVALAAKILGIKSVIVMSPDVDKFKIEATKGYGAEVVMGGAFSEEKKELAMALAEKHGYYFIPPYDHLDVITGQGSIGIELAEDVKPDFIFVPVGGGGLISGIACAIKQIYPNVKIIGVESYLENDAYISFKYGIKHIKKKPSHSIADGIKVQTLGVVTYPFVTKYVDSVIYVTEGEIIEAMKLIVEKSHMIAEPSGALSLAGYFKYIKSSDVNGIVVCVLSGGNISIKKMDEIFHR